MGVMKHAETETRILVIGCGGIGGVIACKLVKAGLDVTLATPNAEVRARWLDRGPTLGAKPLGITLPKHRLLKSAREASAPFDVALICVQPTELEEVAHSLEGKLTERGRAVCLPNGLCEARLEAILGPERVIGAVVTWGARMKAPGEYVQTSRGGFLVGTLNGKEDAEMPRVVRVLSHVGPAQPTDNLRGARFSKLTINCAVTALGTIGGGTLGELLVKVKARDLAFNLMREAAEVARADGVRLEKVARIDVERLSRNQGKRPLSNAARHALLMALGAKYRRLRSSMLSAIERGRQPAVDYINGEIVRLGQARDIPTPFNRAATEVIWAISRGEMQPGPSALRAVYDVAR